MNRNSQSTLTFVELAPMARARLAPHLHLAESGEVVASGGGHGPEGYDFARDAWRPFAGPLPPRLPEVAGLGGYREYSSWGRDDEVRSLSTGGLICARHQAGAARLPDGTVFVAGGWHDETLTARVELGVPLGVTLDAPRVRAGLDAHARESAHAYVRQTLGQTDFSEAQRVAEMACRTWPGQAQAWGDLADVQLAQGRPAVAAMRRAVELDPDSPFAWSGLGDALAHAGADSTAAFERALALAEEDPTWCHAVIAHARAALSREHHNRGAWARALELDPGNAFAHCARARALLQRGDLRGARASAKRALGEPELREQARALLRRARARTKKPGTP